MLGDLGIGFEKRLHGTLGLELVHPWTDHLNRFSLNSAQDFEIVFGLSPGCDLTFSKCELVVIVWLQPVQLMPGQIAEVVLELRLKMRDAIRRRWRHRLPITYV